MVEALLKKFILVILFFENQFIFYFLIFNVSFTKFYQYKLLVQCESYINGFVEYVLST